MRATKGSTLGGVCVWVGDADCDGVFDAVNVEDAVRLDDGVCEDVTVGVEPAEFDADDDAVMLADDVDVFVDAAVEVDELDGVDGGVAEGVGAYVAGENIV